MTHNDTCVAPTFRSAGADCHRKRAMTPHHRRACHSEESAVLIGGRRGISHCVEDTQSESPRPAEFTVSELLRSFAMGMTVPKAPWSAVAPATAFSLGIQGGSSTAALQGAARIFMQRGEPKDHGICAQDDRAWARNNSLESCFRNPQLDKCSWQQEVDHEA
jgi:hypothetical protein